MATLKKQNIPYTQVANDVLQSPELTPKAKGIYAYLFSKPDDWDFSATRIAGEMACGRDAILSGLKELENADLLVRERLPNGRVEYHLKYAKEPDTENRTLAHKPDTENPTVGKSHGGVSRPVRKKEVPDKERGPRQRKNVEHSFDFNEKLKKMQSGKREMQIIALYWKRKGWTFSNNEQYQAALKRELRPAKMLVGYDDQQIRNTMEHLQEKVEDDDLPKWTLETVHKYVDEIQSNEPDLTWNT